MGGYGRLFTGSCWCFAHPPVPHRTPLCPLCTPTFHLHTPSSPCTPIHVSLLAGLSVGHCWCFAHPHTLISLITGLSMVHCWCFAHPHTLIYLFTGLSVVHCWCFAHPILPLCTPTHTHISHYRALRGALLVLCTPTHTHISHYRALRGALLVLCTPTHTHISLYRALRGALLVLCTPISPIAHPHTLISHYRALRGALLVLCTPISPIAHPHSYISLQGTGLSVGRCWCFAHPFPPLHTHTHISHYRALRGALLVLCTPAVTLLLCIFVHQELEERPVSPSEGWQLFLRALQGAVLQQHLHGAATFTCVALLAYPCWLLMWNVLCWG
uniref:Uncharacterized protein n=1 Tax=Coturnix japonica TaxID=93934 RepID=A0A8C2SSZ0_COTJA